MKWLKAITKGVKATYNEYTKPDSFLKGEEFEEYVRKYLFPKDKYTLIHRTHDYHTNEKDFVSSSLEPDFGFAIENSNLEFYVEVKYRENFFNGKVEWCSGNQLKRYKQISNQIPTLLALGMGGNSNNPDYVYLIPLKDINFTGLFPSFLEKYEVKRRKSISYPEVEYLLGFTKAFCIRCGTKISFDFKHPYCISCYEIWAKFKNKNYNEKYCHQCGNNNSSTIQKPVCYNCYKK